MIVEYELERRDVEAWWTHWSKNSTTYRVNYWITVALIGCGGLWLGWQIATTPGTRMMFALGGVVTGCVVAAVLQRSWIRVSAAAVFKGRATEHHFGSYRLSLLPEGIVEEGPSASHRHGWNAVEGLVQTAEHFFLPVGGGQAYVIPRRGLSRDTSDAFTANATSYLAEEERRRTRR
jgi:hypothetical protein